MSHTFNGCECSYNTRLIEDLFDSAEATYMMSSVCADEHQVWCPVFSKYLILEGLLYDTRY